MLDSIYIGMTGLVSFSHGLSNISNNVANLNTPGFKGSQLAFQDLYYRYEHSGSSSQQDSPSSHGSGVKTGSSSLNFTPGEFRQTGNGLNVAIDGNGLFVLRKDGETQYTRAGQFKIDDAGYLVAEDDGTRVAGMTGNVLTDISIAGKRSSAAKATQTVKFADSLSTISSTFDVSNITVYDSLGGVHSLTLKLTNNTVNVAGQWTFSLVEGSRTLTSGNILYTGSGDAIAGSDTHTFSYDPGTGASTVNLTLDFSGSKYFSSSTSSLKVGSQDGYGAGVLSKTAIDTDGNLVLSYSNGQTVKDQQLALAWFDNLGALQAAGSNRYTVFGDARRHLGRPGENGLGNLKTGGVELSNVDLAQEFSELIIVQRGYQASSQVISAANEMIQQLGEIRGRR